MDVPTARASNPDAGSGLDLVTVAEAARVMRVSKMTVYRLIHTTELPAMRIGRSFRIRQRDLADYLDIALTEPTGGRATASGESTVADLGKDRQ